MKAPVQTKMPNSAQKPTAIIRNVRTVRENAIRQNGPRSAAGVRKVSNHSVREPAFVN